MNCDCEAMDIDLGTISFMAGSYHSFMSTSEATKRGPHQGHNGKYMEVEGPCPDLLDNSSHVS